MKTALETVLQEAQIEIDKSLEWLETINKQNEIKQRQETARQNMKDYCSKLTINQLVEAHEYAAENIQNDESLLMMTCVDLELDSRKPEDMSRYWIECEKTENFEMSPRAFVL